LPLAPLAPGLPSAPSAPAAPISRICADCARGAAGNTQESASNAHACLRSDMKRFPVRRDEAMSAAPPSDARFADIESGSDRSNDRSNIVASFAPNEARVPPALPTRAQGYFEVRRSGCACVGRSNVAGGAWHDQRDRGAWQLANPEESRGISL